MDEKTKSLLKTVIDSQHGGASAYLHSVRVHRQAARADRWDGMVHVYSVAGLGATDRAYAWSAPVEGTSSSRFFSVLHQGAIRGPLEAVEAVVKAIRASV